MGVVGGVDMIVVGVEGLAGRGGMRVLRVCFVGAEGGGVCDELEVEVVDEVLGDGCLASAEGAAETDDHDGMVVCSLQWVRLRRMCR